MWTRAELKERAKAVLHTNYWKAFLISLVIVLATGSGSGSSWRESNSSLSQHSYTQLDSGLIALIFLILAAVAFVIVIALALRILVFYSLEVGGRRYFVQSAQYFDNRGCFRFGFDGRNYTGIISTMFLKGIFNFLWSLLFIIPGIIKYYSYRMVPYILADNPNIGALRAINLSRNMMRGNKWRMFVLDLSFLGWYFIGALCLGIGVLFVNPYAFATEAELYLVLRGNAIEGGMCSLDELNLYDPVQTGYNG
ncbi:MAG TPA: DUF975 family protein [Clostridia bacterium]|nr:DUF975 family protein [Clostridia bacterium]